MSEFDDVCALIIDEGVAEQPPVVGQSYTAFCVHPPQRPWSEVVIAIGHCEGEKCCIDLVKEMRSADADKELDRYGIIELPGAESDGDEDMVNALRCLFLELYYERMSRS